MRVPTDERARRRGATGERATAWWLGRLPKGWYLLNDVPVGERGSSVDHLIVGPAGVFTVNAKNLTGKVWIGASGVRHNGHVTDFVRRSRSEASRAAQLLAEAVGEPVVVRPVLAILADDWTTKGVPDGLFVGSPRRVKDWLLGLPSELEDGAVTRLTAVAARPSTWTG